MRRVLLACCLACLAITACGDREALDPAMLNAGAPFGLAWNLDEEQRTAVEMERQNFCAEEGATAASSGVDAHEAAERCLESWSFEQMPLPVDWLPEGLRDGNLSVLIQRGGEPLAYSYSFKHTLVQHDTPLLQRERDRRADVLW